MVILSGKMINKESLIYIVLNLQMTELFMAQQTLSKLKRMTDSDYDSQKFYFTDENE